MSQFNIGFKLVDTRNNKKCEVVHILEIKGNNLYTIKYKDGQHKRYYENRFTTLFVPSIDNEPVYNPDDYKNVYFVDIKSKTKFANHKSWVAWLETTKRIG